MLNFAFRQAFPRQASLRHIAKLAHIQSSDLAPIFRSPEITERWERARLSEVCQIDDGKTGGVNPGDRRTIFYLISAFKPRSILEIGTHVGASTVHIAAAMEPSATLTTVDIADVNSDNSYWRSYKLAKSPRQMLEEIGRTAEFVTDNSFHFLRKTQQTFDFIFLDGDHSRSTVLNEVALSLARLNEGGTILLHDYFPDAKPLWSDGSVIDGPYSAMKNIPAIRVVPVGELPWPTKLGSHVTSLALLSR